MEKLVKQIIKIQHLLKVPENLPKNLILKLVSLFFAVFLWYFVVGEDKVDTTIYVGMEITNLPQDLVISNQFRKQIEVTINGPRGLVRNISSQHITRPVDLANAQPGSHVIKNTPESIKITKGVQIQNIRPALITLTIDRLLAKELPIKPVLKGKAATGYEVAAFIANPPTLGLTASASILEKEVFLLTKPIDITGRKTDFTIQIPLDVREEITELIGEPEISVNVLIREKLVVREFKGIPVEFNHEAKRTIYRLDYHQVNIKTELPYNLAGKDAQNFHFKAVLDADNLPPGSHELPVRIISNPPDIIVKEIIPARIKIGISSPQAAMKNRQSSPPPFKVSQEQQEQ
ncbi:MAG: CdaR family protein [Thermodesulfobacteriota bacterium]